MCGAVFATVTAPFFGSPNELYDAGLPEDSWRYKGTEHDVYLWVTPLARVESDAWDAAAE